MNQWLAARNILVVRLDNIGDVVMLGPALRAVKETSPQARLTLLASPAGTTAVPLLPWIDDVITWRTIWQDVGGRMPFDPAGQWELIHLLAERKFDAALIFTSFSQTPHVPGYVCYLAGIPLRAGESKEFGGSTLTTELRGAPDEMHQAERNLRLVEHLGFVVKDRHLEVALSEEARAAVPQLLSKVGLNPDAPFILVHPGASAQARRYPAERFGKVARLLTERRRQVLVTGVERESALLETVRQRAPMAGYLVGGTTLMEYAALIERASLVICNDTLPMHLADALRTPEVVLYAGTEYEEQWQPRATEARLLRRPTPCQPCYLFECPIGQPCLDIPPTEVVEEAETLIANYAHYLQRIAIIRALQLGDMLLAVPALRSIRVGFPHAEITLIGLPWAALFVRRFHKYIDRFVEFGGYPGIAEVEYVPERCEGFLEEQRAYGYDLVVQMHGSGRTSDPLALACGGKMTVGYYEGMPPAGLTLGEPYPGDEPEVLRNLGLAKLLGCPDCTPSLEFPLFKEDYDEATALLGKLPEVGRPLIGLHAGARPPSRRWPVEYFAAVADNLASRFGAQILLTGGPGEEEIARAVAERMEMPSFNVAGETSLGGLAALMSKFELFISNDTGPAHIANAVDTPSVTIFGPVDPRRWASLDQARHPIVRVPVECSPCPHWECPIDHRCLLRVRPEMVIAAAEKLLQRGATVSW